MKPCFRSGMNECSLQGYYSGSTTSDIPPQIQAPCHSWGENWSLEKSTSFKTMNTCKIKESQQPPGFVNEFLSEDTENPLMNSSKKKKTGASDPRFKRVINAEFRNAADSDSENLAPNVKISSASSQVNRNQSFNKKVLSFLKPPNDCSILSAEVTKDTGFQLADKYFLNGNLQDFSYNNTSNDIKEDSLDVTEKTKCSLKTNLKRSASDCTMQTKSPLGQNESCENIRAYPSAIKFSNTNNWVKQQKVLPEKRRSVITVIGQTQTKTFSQILSEIHQRRKLAKELDKHALCEALISSMENHSDLKNVVAKVDLVLPDGKIIYSAEKVYTRKDSSLEDSVYSQNSLEILDSDSKRKRCDMIPERDSSGSQLGKRKSKRISRKLILPNNGKFKVKGSIRNIFEDVSSTMLWLFLALFCFGLCFSIFLYTIRTPQHYYYHEFFKPKTAAWYEKLLF